MWLLSKGRDNDARESLQWLRGWVSPDAVKTEFDALKQFRMWANGCTECTNANIQCKHLPPTFMNKLHDLCQPRNLQPFCLLSMAFFIVNFCGIYAMRPYLVQILQVYRIPISSNWASVGVGLAGMCGTITCVCFVALIGKRRLYLISLSAACAAIFGLGRNYLHINNILERLHLRAS